MLMSSHGDDVVTVTSAEEVGGFLHFFKVKITCNDKLNRLFSCENCNEIIVKCHYIIVR